MTAAERAQWVFAEIDELIAGLPVSPDYQSLLAIHVGVGRIQLQECPTLPAVHLPMLVHAAITGDEMPAMPLAAACTLLYLGADLFDNVADGELPLCWQASNPALANLAAAAALLCALPPLAIARLEQNGVAPARLWALTKMFAATLATMSAGQYDDLIFSEQENVTIASSRRMSEQKSGAEIGLFARAGAMLATDDAPLVEEYAGFGACIGTAAQIASDLGDIFAGAPSRDLLNGKQTLPVLHALSTLQGQPLERLRSLLVAATLSGDCHTEVCHVLQAAGSLRYVALVVEIFRQRALTHLRSARPREPARSELYHLLANASLLKLDETLNDRGEYDERRSSDEFGGPRNKRPAFRAQAQNDLEGALKQHGYDLNAEELAAVKAFHGQTVGKSDQEINGMLAGNAQQRRLAA